MMFYRFAHLNQNNNHTSQSPSSFQPQPPVKTPSNGKATREYWTTKSTMLNFMTAKHAARARALGKTMREVKCCPLHVATCGRIAKLAKELFGIGQIAIFFWCLPGWDELVLHFPNQLWRTNKVHGIWVVKGFIFPSCFTFLAIC